MSFFSKIVTLCNVGFIFVALYKLLQFTKDNHANNNAVEPTGILVGTAAVLYVLAIIFSLLFAILVLIKRFRKHEINIHPLLILFNLLMLPIQIWYFFFYN